MLFSVFTHVTKVLTTVAIRHLGVQTNAVKLMLRSKSRWFCAYFWIATQEAGISFFRVPSIDSNHGEEAKERSIERRTQWIARDELTKKILQK